MDRELFIQPSVRIRLAEKKLLTKQQFERLADTKTLADAMKLLNETAYSNKVSKLDRPENYEQILSEELDEMYKNVLEISPEADLVKVFSYKYGYHNLKVAVKEYLLNSKFDSMYANIDDRDVEKIREEVETGKNMDKWYSEVLKDALKLYKETEDPQDIDIFVDKKYFEKVLELADSFKLEMIEEYFKALIDFTNVKTYVRCKKQNQSSTILEKALIPGGDISTSEISSMYGEDVLDFAVKFKNTKIGQVLVKSIKEYKETGLLQSYEKYMDDYLTGIIKNTKSVNYGAEVVFSYIYAKEMEIKNLRIIFIGKVNELSPEFIRERLRETYV